jgi:rhomboid protease GluP
MLGKGALSWYFVMKEKEYYRVLTSMFMHSDFGHLFNNMLVLLFVGDNLERAAGKYKYLFIYFGTGILAGITSISYNMWKENGQYLIDNTVFSIGASGAIFGVVGAMLYIVAINRGRLEDISTRQMVLFVVFSLYGGITNTQIDQAAHVGGFLAGILLAAIVYRRRSRTVVTE